MSEKVTNPLLRADGLTRKFGDRLAVQDLTFEAHRGRVLGVLGPNGSGKSTTVRLVTGLLRPTSGSVELFSEPVTPKSAPRLRTRIGVQTEANLYHRLTVAENLQTWGELHGLSKAKTASRIDQVLEIVGLTQRRKSTVGSLSKGLRQKAKIARALLNEPELLFLDEPTAGLDPEASEDLVNHLVELRSEFGTTIVLCTHQLHGLERICDDVVVLVNGQMVAAGQVGDLLKQNWPNPEYTIRVSDLDVAERIVADLEHRGVAAQVTTEKPSLHELYFRLLPEREES